MNRIVMKYFFLFLLFVCSALIPAFSANADSDTEHWIWVHGTLSDEVEQHQYLDYTNQLVVYFRQGGLSIDLISEEQYLSRFCSTLTLSEDQPVTIVHAGPVQAFRNLQVSDLPIVIEKKQTDSPLFRISSKTFNHPRTGLYLPGQYGRHILYLGLSYEGFKDIFTVSTGGSKCVVTVSGCQMFEGHYSSDEMILKRVSFLPEYPSETDLNQIDFPAASIIAAPVSSSDEISTGNVNPGFLRWLTKRVSGKRVLFVGETHWSRNVNRLFMLMLLHLADAADVGSVFLELNYSFSGYYNHYVTLADNDEAADFLADRLHYLVQDETQLEFLKRLREWNSAHSEKKIRVGCLDMEWGIGTVIDNIISPYFRLIDPDFKITNGDLETDEAAAGLCTGMETLLLKAEKESITGEHPFLTPAYMKTVVQNFRDTLFLRDMDGDRQSAIIRNITRYNASLFNSGMVLFHGGGWHAVKNPDDRKADSAARWYRDAEYLQHHFAPTRGKVHSMMVYNLGYGFRSIANLNLDKRMGSADYYNRITRFFQKAYELNYAGLDDYFMLDDVSKLDLALARYGIEKKVNIFRISRVDWKGLAQTFGQSLDGTRAEFEQYDDVIQVLKSQIERTRPIDFREDLQLDFQPSPLNRQIFKPFRGKKDLIK
ncbi:MAG: hypothetical protein CVV64_16350 [Candidatus Wallbacteria bacterium HGW-Wallbacteria-1]|uniref:Haem-binding uptake Tiki superfamily ChaN domain-containing protein n=1 Tax=Candidatus Wallbacteria bacterium HGW-Wallbacteria-1 TaxID=2013854 RepID=A0A2N1PKX2_9BACT|nr:MAG: hypothetical protein CVV64_16350 [Candidatus Wallbacteria bacterium HGW-Wallbacteria-1]